MNYTMDNVTDKKHMVIAKQNKRIDYTYIINRDQVIMKGKRLFKTTESCIKWTVRKYIVVSFFNYFNPFKKLKEKTKEKNEKERLTKTN